MAKKPTYVAQAIKRLNMTQCELAAALGGINQSSVSRLVRGESKPSRMTKAMIERLLKEAGA
jgi:predicted XRE-type DNA-binding protein